MTRPEYIHIFKMYFLFLYLKGAIKSSSNSRVKIGFIVYIQLRMNEYLLF